MPASSPDIDDGCVFAQSRYCKAVGRYLRGSRIAIIEKFQPAATCEQDKGRPLPMTDDSLEFVESTAKSRATRVIEIDDITEQDTAPCSRFLLRI